MTMVGSLLGHCCCCWSKFFDENGSVTLEWCWCWQMTVLMMTMIESSVAVVVEWCSKWWFVSVVEL